MKLQHKSKYPAWEKNSYYITFAMAHKGEHITQSHAQDNRNYLPTQSSADMLLGNPCFRFSPPPGRQPKSPTRITPIKILHQYWLNDNGAVEQ